MTEKLCRIMAPFVNRPYSKNDVRTLSLVRHVPVVTVTPGGVLSQELIDARSYTRERLVMRLVVVASLLMSMNSTYILMYILTEIC